MAQTTAATRTARARAGLAARASTGTRRSSTATAAPATPTAAGGWARTTSAVTQMVMCSHGATWPRQRRASTGATAISPRVICLGTWAASWTPGHPRPSAAPAAPQQSSLSSWRAWRLATPVSVALKATWPGDARLRPPTVTRSALATRASCAAVMGAWASTKCPWAPARGTGLHLKVSSTPRTSRTSTGRTGTVAGRWAPRAPRWSSPSASSSWRTSATSWSCATPPRAACSAPSTAPARRRRGRCACAPSHCCSPSAATLAATRRASHSPTAVRPRRVPPQPAPPPACLTPLSAGLQDADDPAPPKGSAQTPAGPPDGANMSCSPRPGTPEAAIGAQVFLTVTAVSVLLLLLLSLLRLLRGRSCLLAPGKGPPALGPSRDPARSWAVWYRRPRGVALPCPPGDPQVESLTASYRPLSASSQSSLRSLISAL
ncbi:kremen protein 2 isoform X5 [Lagenorhynchus albirostris]|uniref:kremen protein 2 isoform X5 n=2 Tax=Lagenorhynchus albirostris TaxID=27610 RepID=UPI0028EF5AE2|nr:kremen protein 2 isoform X5 [Lagenorhynchus albirostris]XP_059978600.1 kremen protein 2 isoform X5 [Lagenorhynchus albirostris]